MQSDDASSFLKRKFGTPKNILAWRDVLNRLNLIEPQIQNLKNQKEFYGISKIEAGGSSSRARAENRLRLQHVSDLVSLGEEDEFIGNMDETNKLIEWLMSDTQSRTVISILGMGGLGKTYCCRRVYRSPEITRHFNCVVWISVSQSYQVEDILKRIIKEVAGGYLEGLDHVKLAERLQFCLRNRKYLVFLDDVWDTDAWPLLDQAFMKNNLGSRIVLTTRIKNVASLAHENHVIELNKLPGGESWTLFCSKAFSRIEGRECPPSLRNWAEKIVAKCQGLPLAIVAIGSLLSYREKEEEEWRSFYRQLNWQFANNPDLDWVMNTLYVSFSDLPDDLKNCLLYCGLYPEDFPIKRKGIIRSWIAEGFVEERGAMTTKEEVAGGLLRELENRSLLQVARRNPYGKPKVFNIHDLVREMTLTISRKQKFGVLLNNISDQTSATVEARRVLVAEDGIMLPPSVQYRQFRSFILVGVNMNPSFIHDTLPWFRLLRVLCLTYCNIGTVPDAIAELYNLHYLDLSFTYIKQIPKSFGNLKNIQTLDLRWNLINELPNEITLLTKLRHLVVGLLENFMGFGSLGDISRLKDLQTLQFMKADKYFISGLVNLKMLKTLCIETIEPSSESDVWASICKLPRLTTLTISDYNGNLDLENLKPLPTLEVLRLWGKWEKPIATPAFGSLCNLRKLKLWYSGLQEDPLPSFSLIASLVKLALRGAYNGQLLIFRAEWFPKLRFLLLQEMIQLSAVEIEEGTMRNLSYMRLQMLPSLKSVPSGLANLRLLQELDIKFMSEEFNVRLRGSESGIVQHVPDIIID
ncbi:hypothetical protein LUZ60_017191 [Juncus effusus]|nr:hypothetical protein LUZ60_017191 [Juncus effusus]